MQNADVLWILGLVPDRQNGTAHVLHAVGEHRRGEIAIVGLAFVHVLVEFLLSFIERLGNGELDRPHERMDALADILKCL